MTSNGAVVGRGDRFYSGNIRLLRLKMPSILGVYRKTTAFQKILSLRAGILFTRCGCCRQIAISHRKKIHVLSILSMGSSAVSAYRLCCIQLVLPATGRLYFYRRLIVCLFAGLPKNYSISLHKIHHIQWRSSTRATEETTR